MNSEHTPTPGNCDLCDAPVPDADLASVVHDVGPHCAAMYPVCEDCHTPEFQSYLDAMEAFWKEDGGRNAA